MKWIAYVLLFFSWAFAGTGVLLWLFGSMFNDSPSGAATFQRIINGWPSVVVAAIAVTIAVVVLKDPKWRVLASLIGFIVCFILFIRPFNQISAVAQETREKAAEQNRAELDAVRAKLMAPDAKQLPPEELALAIKTLHTLVDSQGDAALEVLHAAIKSGVISVSSVARGKEVIYPTGETRVGDVPLLNSIAYGKASILKVYLEEGANPNVADTAFGLTPLMKVAITEPDADNVEKVELLLAHGADANARDLKGKTARDHALFARQEAGRYLDQYQGTDSYAKRRREEIEGKLALADAIIARLSR